MTNDASHQVGHKMPSVSTADSNRFLAGIDEVSKAIVGPFPQALQIAKDSFVHFRDYPESHYYQAAGLTPEQTWTAVTQQVARVTVIAMIDGAEKRLLDVEDLHLIHQGIFEPVFGAETLDMRKYEEQVAFGVTVGERSDPIQREQHGVSARSLPFKLKKVIEDLNEAAKQSDDAENRGEAAPLSAVTLPAAQAYCRFLAYHPYFDGNGRTAFPLLAFALVRLGVVAVSIPESADFHWCLGRGMRRNNRDFGPFSRYLESILHKSDAALIE